MRKGLHNRQPLEAQRTRLGGSGRRPGLQLRRPALDEDANVDAGLREAPGQQPSPVLRFLGGGELQGLQPVETLDNPTGAVATHVQQDVSHAYTHVPRRRGSADLEAPGRRAASRSETKAFPLPLRPH